VIIIIIIIIVIIIIIIIILAIIASPLRVSIFAVTIKSHSRTLSGEGRHGILCREKRALKLETELEIGRDFGCLN
jgi:capsule polysaccharide export protein KpsE/RkpR